MRSIGFCRGTDTGEFVLGDPPSIRVLDLGLIDYMACLERQRELAKAVGAGDETGVLLLLEHPPTVTLGTRGSPSDLVLPPETLAAHGVGLHHIDRGGEATFHGPGQLIAYPILDLRLMGLTVREYVYRLEETIIRVLAAFGVDGFRRAGKVGIWTGPKDKIASIGIRLRNRVTYHGFSLNVSLEDDPSRFVVCCGMPDARMASLNEFVHPPVPMDTVKHTVAHVFAELVGRRACVAGPD